MASKPFRIALSLLLMMFLHVARAQVQLDFSGYVVDLPIYESANELLSRSAEIDEDLLFNLTRVRLRPAIFPWSNARVSLEYELTSLYHSSRLTRSTTPDRMNRQTVDLRWDPVRSTHFTVSHFVDRFYLRQSFNFGNITIGRQRIAWGTGRVWNPIDLFNPINPASFDKIEKDGADALSVKFYFGSFTDLALVYNLQSSFDQYNVGFRFRTNVGAYDLSTVGGYFDKRIIVGGDFAGNLFDAGIRGEGIISARRGNPQSNFVKFIVGLDRQFTSRLYALIEYQFNGEGTTDRSAYDLSRLEAGEILNLSRNYLFIQASYLFHPLLTVASSLNANLNDGSGFIGALASLSATENFSFHVGVQVSYGNRLDEYWYYPDAAYLKGDLYF